ncbi:MAG: type III-B CRISPR-associated protein Cas10/Cmr2 [Desulfamplus sp.]
MNKRDNNYWEQKIRHFLHDPIDKALRIQGHEGRAKQIADAFGVSTPSKDEVSHYDCAAAGMDRANLPGHSDNTAYKGSIDFYEFPQITHPISGGSLKFTGAYKSAQETTQQIVELINQDTNDTNQRWDKQTYFNYLFFLLRKRVIYENCGNLGFLWDRIPADTRMPDHSIWNHSGMVSALSSCFTMSRQNRDNQINGVSMVVFAIAPVQPFITKTRKLRDHWVASVILSWLAFEGICSVMENLGPDHVLYPSLQEQPLVEAFLSKNLSEKFGKFFKEFSQDNIIDRDKTVASFPNKFVFLAPAGMEEEFVKEIEARIRKEWKELSNIVLDWLGEKADKKEHLKPIFNRQTDNFWQFNWSSAYLVTLDKQDEINSLFKGDKFKHIFQTIEDFAKYNIYKKKDQPDYVYPVTHSLVQTVMAASKGVPTASREPEPGIKCPVCGEFEILHEISGKDYQPSEYKKISEKFWNSISKSRGEATVKEGEQLCSICAIKRLAPHTIKELKKDHILATVFKSGKFPSTTEMATVELRDELRAKKELPALSPSGEMSKIEEDWIDKLHEESDDRLKEEDKYYAILMMDGDRMGDLVNGKTVAAKWRDVLHPELVKRYDSGKLKANEKLWKDAVIKKEDGSESKGYLGEQRIISPALHSALSESLGAFALHAVPLIIKNCQGKLVYAGGDDVAAVLPLSRAFEAAAKIQKAYNTKFATIDENGVTELREITDGKNPVILLPGTGDGISISAAVVILHHKQPLRGALEEAHHLLESVAKSKKGRNAVAVRLKKRSGQTRDFAAKWNAENSFYSGLDDDGIKGKSNLIVDSFGQIQKAYDEEYLSSSVIYRFQELKVMVNSVMNDDSTKPVFDSENKNPKPSPDQIEQIIRIFAREILHSGNIAKKHFDKEKDVVKLRERIARRLAAHIAGITISWGKGLDDNGKEKEMWLYDGEVPVIARYLSRGGATS